MYHLYENKMQWLNQQLVQRMRRLKTRQIVQTFIFFIIFSIVLSYILFYKLSLKASKYYYQLVHTGVIYLVLYKLRHFIMPSVSK